MDFEGLAELIVPLALFGIIGGLIALRMLKPYGDKILQLVREIQKDRHEALSETREMQSIRDRLDMLAERQDVLEALVKHRLDEDEQRELEELRRRALSPEAGGGEADGPARARQGPAGPGGREEPGGAGDATGDPGS